MPASNAIHMWESSVQTSDVTRLFFSQVFHDDDIIPGWEGKIVAWVEEDHGEN